MLKHHCDRCDKITDIPGDALQRPDGWQALNVDAKDKANLTARRLVTVCGECDRDLTRWFERSGLYALRDADDR